MESSKGRRAGAVELTVLVPPVPASRPRVSKWGTYYLKTYKAYRIASSSAIPVSSYLPLEGNLRATIEFACAKPKTTKRLCPQGDIDNHVKAILDSVVGDRKEPKGYIVDDMQITELTALKRWVFPDEQPHTRIVIERL